MRALILLLLVFSNSSIAAGEGDLQFALAGRQYATQNAVGLLRIKNGKCRILVAVKDINQRFLFMMTADVPVGHEKQSLHLSSADTDLSVTLRSSQGVFALLPHQQLHHKHHVEHRMNNELPLLQ